MADIPYWERGRRDFDRARQNGKKLLSWDWYEQACPHNIPDDGDDDGDDGDDDDDDDDDDDVTSMTSLSLVVH